jgi:hypothetical protein
VVNQALQGGLAQFYTTQLTRPERLQNGPFVVSYSHRFWYKEILMKNQSNGWQQPLTPWSIVQQRFFKGQTPGAAAFSKKHSLDEAAVRQVFSGQETAFSPELCTALSRETRMSEQFFRNLSDRHQQRTAA